MALHTQGLTPDDPGFYHDYFGQLVGAKITGFKMAVDEEFGEFWPTFEVTLASGDRVEVEVSQDEEGNGPGWLFGLPDPRSTS